MTLLQENVTERVMAPVVWDADADNEESGEGGIEGPNPVGVSAPPSSAVAQRKFVNEI